MRIIILLILMTQVCWANIDCSNNDPITVKATCNPDGSDCTNLMVAPIKCSDGYMPVQDLGHEWFCTPTEPKSIKFPKYKCERQPSPCTATLEGYIHCPKDAQIDGGYICSPIEEK